MDPTLADLDERISALRVTIAKREKDGIDSHVEPDGRSVAYIDIDRLQKQLDRLIDERAALLGSETGAGVSGLPFLTYRGKFC